MRRLKLPKRRFRNISRDPFWTWIYYGMIMSVVLLLFAFRGLFFALFVPAAERNVGIVAEDSLSEEPEAQEGDAPVVEEADVPLLSEEDEFLNTPPQVLDESENNNVTN